MKMKYDYIKSKSETINVEIESDIMLGSPKGFDMGDIDEYKGGAAGSGKRSFWEKINE